MSKNLGWLAKMLGAIAITVGMSATAEASIIWNFSFTGGGYSATGQFTTGDAGSPYTVTGISGTADGFAITGLSGYAGANQLLYVPPTGGFHADFSGISFSNANGVNYNITNFPSGSADFLNISTLDGIGSGCCGVAISMSVSVADVPEPSAWAMIGLGLAGLGFLRWRSATAAGSCR